MSFFKIRITLEAVLFSVLAVIAVLNRDGKVTAKMLLPNTNVIVSQKGPDVIDARKPVTYLITVTNVGALRARGVVVSSIVPPGLSFLPGSSDPLCAPLDRIVHCGADPEEAIPLEPGQSVSFRVSYSVDPEFGCQATVLHTALAETALSIDPNFSDNIARMLSSFSCAKKQPVKVQKKGVR